MTSTDKSGTSQEIAKYVLESWYEVFSDFFYSLGRSDEIPQTFFRALCDKKARQCIKVFQGNSQLYVITGDRRYFDEMEMELLEIVNGE